MRVVLVYDTAQMEDLLITIDAEPTRTFQIAEMHLTEYTAPSPDTGLLAQLELRAALFVTEQPEQAAQPRIELMNLQRNHHYRLRLPWHDEEYVYTLVSIAQEAGSSDAYFEFRGVNAPQSFIRLRGSNYGDDNGWRVVEHVEPPTLLRLETLLITRRYQVELGDGVRHEGVYVGPFATGPQGERQHRFRIHEAGEYDQLYLNEDTYAAVGGWKVFPCDS